MRSCGDCRECCIQYDVAEFDKKAGTPCPKLCGSGCSIYPDRPTSCQEFVCAWLLGELGINDKPSKTKMVCTAGEHNGQTVIFGTYQGKPHKKTVRWLMQESYRLPVLLGRAGKPYTAYENGREYVGYRSA